MQQDSSNLKINLGKVRDENPTGIFVKWAVNAGRVIIVGVELVALLALGFRFIVDRQIVDTHDVITTELKIIDAQKKNENLYRNLQGRLTSIQTLEDETQGKVNFLKDLLTFLNTNEFISSSLSVSSSSVSIEGQSYSIFSLNTLVNKLKQNPHVLSISIDELTSLDQGIKFKITTQLQQSNLTF